MGRAGVMEGLAWLGLRELLPSQAPVGASGFGLGVIHWEKKGLNPAAAGDSGMFIEKDPLYSFINCTRNVYWLPTT